MAPGGEADPQLSLLVALYDIRGDAAEHLRAWTHRQALPRERYQVIVASAADNPAGEAEIESLLAPGDVFVRAPGSSEVGLYDVAAARARAPWLFITEAHCLGEPECLATVARMIEAEPELDVVTVEIERVGSNHCGRLGARWFADVYDQWAQLDWAVLPLAGYAVRREAYQRAGGLDARYGLFSAALLSARLNEQGVTVGRAPGARVIHVQPETIQEHHGHSTDFAMGECTFRHDDPAFSERYFGHADTLGNRLRFRPEVARPLARGLLSATARAVTRRSDDARWMLRELLRRLIPAIAGTRLHVLRELLVFGASEQLVQRAPLPEDRLYPWYLRAQDRVVQLTRLRWVRDHAQPPPPPLRSTGSWSAEAVGGVELVGGHGLERHDGRSFRWTEPAALLRLVPPTGEHLLTIDTGGLRGAPLDYVRGVYAGGRSLDPDSMRAEDGRVTMRLSPDFVERAAETGVVLLTRPLDPRREGSSDARRLGMPIFSVDLRSAR